jgi:hypothetical protein
MTLRVKKKSILSRVGDPQRKCFLDMGFRKNFFQPKGFRVKKKAEKLWSNPSYPANLSNPSYPANLSIPSNPTNLSNPLNLSNLPNTSVQFDPYNLSNPPNQFNPSNPFNPSNQLNPSNPFSPSFLIHSICPIRFWT